MWFKISSWKCKNHNIHQTTFTCMTKVLETSLKADLFKPSQRVDSGLMWQACFYSPPGHYSCWLCRVNHSQSTGGWDVMSGSTWLDFIMAPWYDLRNTARIQMMISLVSHSNAFVSMFTRAHGHVFLQGKRDKYWTRRISLTHLKSQ